MNRRCKAVELKLDTRSVPTAYSSSKPKRDHRASGDHKSSEGSVVVDTANQVNKNLVGQEALMNADSALIAELLAGSGHAWEQLIDQYGGLIRSRVENVAGLFAMQRDWALIDDVTAEVFATLLARDGAVLQSFGGRCQLGTYLAVIATRIARRVVSRTACRPQQSNESIDQTDGQTLTQQQCFHDPVASLIHGEDRDRVSNLIQRLPNRQQELLQAFYRDELTYSQISERLNIPLGSIGTTLRRAEQQLRQWIDDE